MLNLVTSSTSSPKNVRPYESCCGNHADNEDPARKLLFCWVFVGHEVPRCKGALALLALPRLYSAVASFGSSSIARL